MKIENSRFKALINFRFNQLTKDGNVGATTKNHFDEAIGGLLLDYYIFSIFEEQPNTKIIRGPPLKDNTLNVP